MVLGTQTQEMVIKPVSNPSMVMDLGCNNLPKPELCKQENNQFQSFAQLARKPYSLQLN